MKLALVLTLLCTVVRAQTPVKANQGRPGNQGGLKVSLSSDGGGQLVKEPPHGSCVNTTMNVGTTGIACPASQYVGRSSILISLNQAGQTLRVTTNGTTATSTTGVQIVSGSSYFDNLSSTVAPSCRCSTATCEVNIVECPPTTAPVLVKDYEWPWAGARLPQASDPGLVSYAGVGAVTGSTTTWESMGPDAGAEGTVTDRGCAIIDSFIPGVKAMRINGTCSPKVDSVGIFNAFQTTHAHSVVVFGYSPEVSGYAIWMAANVGYGYYGLYSTSNQCHVNDWDFNIVTTAAPTPTTAYGAMASTYDGATTMGAASTVAAYVTAPTVADRSAAWGVSDHVFWYGDRLQHDLGMNGVLIGAPVYNTNVGSLGIQNILHKLFGTYSPAGLISGGPTTTLGLDNTATTGNIDPVKGYGMITSQGIRTGIGTNAQNTWSADTSNLALDTDIGTPIINANVSSGPLAVWKNAAECDELVDDDPVVQEGKEGVSNDVYVTGATNGWICLKAGLTGVTRTEATFQINVTGGTGSVSLAITGLTSTCRWFALKSVAVGGGVTAKKPRILQGTSAQQTGSIQVCYRQHTATIDPQVPGLDNAARGNMYYTISPMTDGWPSAAVGGYYEAVHVPPYDPNADWVSATQGTYYLFDAAKIGTDHTVAVVFGYTIPGRLLVTFRDLLGGVSDQTVDGVSLIAGQLYATKAAWIPVGGGKCKNYVYHDSCGTNVAAPTDGGTPCHATTLVSSDVTGTAVCPGTPTSLTIGNRNDNTIPSSLVMSAFRVAAY